MNLRDTNLEGSVDSLEVALDAEISATNSDVTRIDGNVTSLETRVSSEEVARLAGDTYQEETVTGVAGAAGVAVPFNTVGDFKGGVYDTEIYVNGLRVAFTQGGPNAFELNLNYDLEPTDIVRVVGVKG